MLRRTSLGFLLVASCVPAVAQDAEEWDRPYGGFLRGVGAGETIEPDTLLGTRVVDALTRRPVAGATILRYTEMAGPRAELLDVVRTDRHGVATFSAGNWTAECHWIVRADGYAPAHDYGEGPSDEIALERGMDVDVLLIDALGAPLDGDVELFLGCGHGPTIQAGPVGTDGGFRLENVALPEARLWVNSSNGEADVLLPEDALLLGSRGRPLVHAPGGVLRGRVVGPLGAPIEGVQISAIQDARGPYGITDRDGRFELRGVLTDLQLRIWHLLADDAFIVDDVRPTGDVPLTIRMSPLGLLPREGGTVTVRVLPPRIDGPEPADTPPVGWLGVRLLSLTDGWTDVAYYGDEDEEEPAEFFDVPPGRYRLLPDGLLGRLSFRPHEIEVRADESPVVELPTYQQTPLQVLGRVPGNASVTLAVPDAREMIDVTAAGDAVYLPADVPAAVAVVLVDTSFEFRFPVGPAVEGVRTARAVFPEPHRIRVVGEYREAELTYRGEDVDYRVLDDDVFETYAAGDLSLDVRLDVTGDEDEYESYPVTLPDGPAKEVVVDLARDRPPPNAVVRLEVAGEPAPEIRVTTFHGHHRRSVADIEEGGVWKAQVRAPCHVYAEREGYQPLRVAVDSPGERRLEWGPCAIAVRLRANPDEEADGAGRAEEEDADGDGGGDGDGNGEPPAVTARVIVDGEPHWSANGALDLAGLTAGPHVILIIPEERRYVARELRIVLAAGETRTLDLELDLR